MTPRLLAIVPEATAPPASVVDGWIESGADRGGLALLLREPGRPPAAVLDPRGRLAAVHARAQALGFPVVLGCAATDLDTAVAAVRDRGLAGIQLRGDPDATTLSRARARLGGAWLGRSCHGAPQGGHALVDYTVVAPIHPTPSHPGAPALGLAGLRAWCAEPDARIVALGGIGRAEASACARAGAWGLAGISAFFGPDQSAAVAAFVSALRASP